MLYNVLLFSAVQWSGSAIYIHISHPSRTFSHPQTHVGHHRAPSCLSLLYSIFPPSYLYDHSWTIKKAKHQSIDTFELWYWRRLLRVPWIARRSHQSILKEINREYSLEGLMLKLNLQYFGHVMWRVDSLEKTLMLGKTEGKRRMGQQRMRWFDGTTQWTWVWAYFRR